MTHCVSESMRCGEHGAVSGRAGRSFPHRLGHRERSGDDGTALPVSQALGGGEGGRYRHRRLTDVVAECSSFVKVRRKQTDTGK
jgi:hypothetical protein